MFKVLTTAAAVTLTGIVAGAASANVVVSDFGENGWYSGDSRDSSGVYLFGENYTHDYITRYVNSAVPGHDAIIADQIQFVEGPAGSLDGKGAVRLYSTTANSGKSHLSVLNPAGFADGSALVDPNFFFDYRYYNEMAPKSRTVGISISVTDGAFVYNFSHVDPTNTADSWNDNHVTATTGVWRLYGGAGAVQDGSGNNIEMTLADWANDATYGDLLTSSGSIVQIGFNLGSYQWGNVTYMDWIQTSLLEGGDLIDFQAAAVPEPGSLALLAASGGLLLVRRRRRNA